MDSERRHELETNDLREFLDNFKDFWEKHGNKLLIVLIIVLGGYAGYNYYNSWKDGKQQEAQNQLAGATTVDELLKVAEEYSAVHDEAMRRAGDISLSSARKSLIEGSDASAKKPLEQAGSAYTALAERGETTEYKLIGHEGLAKVAIMSGKWDQAKSSYDKMKQLAGTEHPAQAARAEAGLTQLDLLKNPVAFAPEDDFNFDPDADPEPDTDGDAGDGGTGEGNEGDTILPDIDLPGLDLPGLDQP